MSNGHDAYPRDPLATSVSALLTILYCTLLTTYCLAGGTAVGEVSLGTLSRDETERVVIGVRRERRETCRWVETSDLLTTYYLLPTTYYVRPATFATYYYLPRRWVETSDLLTTHYLPPTTYYLLRTTYYFCYLLLLTPQVGRDERSQRARRPIGLPRQAARTRCTARCSLGCSG